MLPLLSTVDTTTELCHHSSDQAAPSKTTGYGREAGLGPLDRRTGGFLESFTLLRGIPPPTCRPQADYLFLAPAERPDAKIPTKSNPYRHNSTDPQQFSLHLLIPSLAHCCGRLQQYDLPIRVQGMKECGITVCPTRQEPVCPRI